MAVTVTAGIVGTYVKTPRMGNSCPEPPERGESIGRGRDASAGCDGIYDETRHSGVSTPKSGGSGQEFSS